MNANVIGYNIQNMAKKYFRVEVYIDPLPITNFHKLRLHLLE